MLCVCQVHEAIEQQELGGCGGGRIQTPAEDRQWSSVKEGPSLQCLKGQGMADAVGPSISFPCCDLKGHVTTHQVFVWAFGSLLSQTLTGGKKSNHVIM